MDTTCPFYRIAHKDLAAHEVFRNDRLVAFLDSRPNRPGHVQIIPIAHHPWLETLPGDIAGEIMLLAQSLARCQKSLFSVPGVAFLFTGGDIPHAHCHVVPVHEKTDITSRRYIADRDLTFQPRPPADETDQQTIAGLISKSLSEENDLRP